MFTVLWLSVESSTTISLQAGLRRYLKQLIQTISHLMTLDSPMTIDLNSFHRHISNFESIRLYHTRQYRTESDRKYTALRSRGSQNLFILFNNY